MFSFSKRKTVLYPAKSQRIGLNINESELFNQPQTNTQHSLSWYNIGYTVDKNKKRILNNISNSVHSNQLTAIMGPSGAGKTSLINILTGRIKSHEGTVCIDNKIVSNAQRRNMIAYVNQFDYLHENATAHESVYFSAVMRLDTSKQDKLEERIRDLFFLLGLQGKEHQKIHTLSGGQKKTCQYRK